MLQIIKHVIIHALEDNISIIPFLFVTYCIMEYMERFMAERSERIVRYSGRMGPLLGGIMGIVPQCGFSAAAASLYSGGVITLGTMLAIFLSTSDEMLPMLISASIPFLTIVKILAAKAFIGVFSGFLIDFIFRKKEKFHLAEKHIHDLCVQDSCCCEEEGSIFKSAAVHTIKVFGFVFVVAVFLNLLLECGGEVLLEQFMAKNSVLSAFLTGLVGLIPNCASSVIITQLYLSGIIHAGAMMAGLLIGTGVGVLVLFRSNRPAWQNIKIVALLYAIGVISGLIIDILEISF